MVADELAGRPVTELAVVVVGRDDGKLLDYVPVQTRALNLLSCAKVKA